MFKYRTFLPGEQRYVYARQMTSREHFEISKTINNRDDDRIRLDFNELLLNWCDDVAEIEDLYTIDVFCLLLNVRIMSISDNMTLSYKKPGDETNKNYKIDLYEVLDKATNNQCEHNIKYTIGANTDVIVKTNTGMFDESNRRVIREIHTKKQTIDTTKLTNDQYIEIMDQIPATKLKEISERHNTNMSVIDIPIIPGDNAEQQGFNVTLSSGMYEFIKLCYTANLQDYYNTRYILTKRCNMDMNYLDSLPTSDITSYLNLYRQELDAEKKAHDKASRSRNINLPASDFAQH